MAAISRPKFVKAHILRDFKLSGWEDRINHGWNYQHLRANPLWFKGWMSFDAVTWNPKDKRLYCGLNSLDSDLLYSFNPSAGQFESMNTQQWADQYDVKIHRTLLLNPKDQCFYFATSLLHDVDQQHVAKGGKLVKFNPQTRQYQVICVPVPHLYIQSIAADWERSIIYGFTYPAEAVFKTDLRTGSSEILAYIGNSIMFVQPHNAVVDMDGWLWGTYAETRAWDETNGEAPVRLFKYHPDLNEFVWFEHGLRRKADKKQLLDDPPMPAGTTSALAETRHGEDLGFCDSMAYDGERYIYAGTVAGVLNRIDARTGAVEKIANAISSARFPGLVIKEGILYGGGGMKGCTQLIRWDTRTDRIESFAEIVEQGINERPERIHELAVDDEHQIFLGENDNNNRSSYLWAVRLE